MSLSPGAEIRVAFRYTYLGQRCENVQSYICQGIAFTGVSMEDCLTALWNDYKDRLHAASPANPDVMSWDSLVGDEVGGALSSAEFPVPTDEKQGTRGTSTETGWVSGIYAWGFRQVVGSRLTRPGQKRFPFLVRNDIIGNTFTSGYSDLWYPVATAFTSPSALGAPVVGGVLQPIIVHEPGVRDPVRHVQDTSGFVFNPNVTSQVSRKLGHGA